MYYNNITLNKIKNIMENREYWSGDKIYSVKENEVFVFGSNPQGRHGAGAALLATKLGAPYGKGRGLISEYTYALVTKNLKSNYREPSTGIVYTTEGYKSVSPSQIRANIDELYEVARQPEHKDKKFLITYQISYWPNGSPKKSLNGYEAHEFLEMFVRDDIPSNIVFHDSYKAHLEKLLQQRTDPQLLGQRMTQQSPSQDKPQEYTYFFQATSPFSQWHPSKFTYKELDFICTEQFMMYAKAKTFSDHKVADKIMNIEQCFLSKDQDSNGFGKVHTLYGLFDSEQDRACYDLVQNFKAGRIDRNQIVDNYQTLKTWKAIQAVIKKLGREVSNYNEEVWVSKRTSVVSVANREKYNQNPDLKEILLATDDTIMVEASPYDKIWGIGLSEADAKKINPLKWPGLNLLGKVLTDLKNYYRNELTPPSKMKM